MSVFAIRNALLATCDRGPHDAGLVPGGAVAVGGDGKIAYAGPDAGLEAAVPLDGAEVVDAQGGLVTPGLVDSHTHLLFAGERAGELAMRCAGKSYLEIAKAGGGIQSTVAATRAASEASLAKAALPRALRLLAHGVTTVEVKSGYGLSVESELAMLRAAGALAHEVAAELEVVPTLLAAHAMPEGVAREAWVRRICEELVPEVAREKLALFCDAFAEESAFTLDEARAVLEAGRRHGLTPRLHADQLTHGGGAQLAAELGCASADHLERVDEAGIAALAKAGVVAGLVPMSTFFIGEARYAPARALLDAGVPVALATNVNPGSAMSENAALTLSLACLALHLTPAEALVAFTAGGARALRRADLGRLAPGAQGDLVLWGCRSVEHLPWHCGVPHALLVVKRGRVAHAAATGAAADCR